MNTDLSDEHRQALEDRDWWRAAGDKLNLELSGWTFRNEASFIDRETKRMVTLPGSVASRLQTSPQPAGVRVKGLPPEPQRPRLDNSEQKFGSCEYCDQRRNLGRDENGALICGPCADEAYLSEWMAYGRALQQALSAQPQKEEAAGWMVERPLRDGGTHLYLPFLRTREEMERYAKANSHETLVALYRATPVQVQESQTVSEDRVTLPRDATADMTADAVRFALSVSISNEYTWPQYMADLWKVMVAAALESSHVKG